MITLEKAGASARINLDKTADMIRVRAHLDRQRRWTR